MFTAIPDLFKVLDNTFTIKATSQLFGWLGRVSVLSLLLAGLSGAPSGDLLMDTVFFVTMALTALVVGLAYYHSRGISEE